MKRIFLLFLIMLVSRIVVNAQAGSCNGDPSYGTRVLQGNDKQKLITYNIKHTFTLYPTVNFAPKIFTVAFNHAWVNEPSTNCKHAKVNPAIQPISFKKYQKDTIINEVPYNNAALVDTLVHLVPNTGANLIDSAFADSCYSRAKASTCVVINPVTSGSVTGVMQSYGFAQAINPPINSDAYAFSWCGVSVQDGKPLKKGDIGWVADVESSLKGKSRNIRQKGGSSDPINFHVHDFNTNLDTSGTLLSVVLDFQMEDDTLDRTNYWSNDTVHIESDSALFKIHFPSPFTASQGLLSLTVFNGFVVQAQATGVFSTVQLPTPGTHVPFSFPLLNAINFHYNLDTTGLFNNDSIEVTLFMFGNNENNNTATYDTAQLVPTPNRPGCPGGNDGSIDLFVNYGTPPYLFSWSNGATTQQITGLFSGNYTVTVTDSLGITSTKTIFLPDPPPMVISASVNQVSCKGAKDGSIAITVSGGTPGYTYLWNNGAHSVIRTSLSPKTYTLTVTDSKGCTAVASYTITQPPALNVNVYQKNATCNGKCNARAKVTPSGGTPPYTYSWSNSATTALITQLCAGTYVCTVTDANGCSKTKLFVILQPPPLSLSAFPGTLPGEATAAATGGTPPYAYKWFTVPLQTTATATGLTGGTVYQVKVIDFNSCTSTILFTMPMNREGHADERATIFPNPAQDVLHVHFENLPAGCIISIIDATGKVILERTASRREEEIDISKLANGLYLVKVSGPDWISAQKIMKE